MTRPGLTYWRCPECGTRVALGSNDTRVVARIYGPGWDSIPAWLALERLIEAHEARHGIGAA